MMGALASTILQTALLRVSGPGTALTQAVEFDIKGEGSLVLYGLAIAMVFV